MKILIAVDGSEASFEAVRQVGSLATVGRDLIALYYSPPRMRFHEEMADAAAAETNVRAKLGAAVFQEAAGHLPDALRAAIHPILGEQAARHGVLTAADQWRADLIVLGARGSGQLAELPLGSVALHVARQATVPVLIVRPRAAGASGPLQVLFATDESEAARQASGVLHHIAWPAGTVGHVMTAIEPLLPEDLPPWLAAQARDPEIAAMAAAWEQEYDRDKAGKAAELAKFAATLPEAFRKEAPIVAEGSASARILETIAARKIDLVIVGASGKNTFQRLLMGSTSEAVLTRAPCSVLIVHQRPRP